MDVAWTAVAAANHMSFWTLVVNEFYEQLIFLVSIGNYLFN